MAKPDLVTVPQWYHGYINLVGEPTANAAIRQNTGAAIKVFHSVPDDKWMYRYAEGKWSIKEVLQHLIDTERIFCYRALCFARKETASLPGFDENDYAAHSQADRRDAESLVDEFITVRRGTELLFASFDEGQFALEGIANNATFSVNAIGFIIAGHVAHHIKILGERYL